MAKHATITTAGENLNAAELGAGTKARISRVVLGRGHVKTLELAKARTGVVTPLNPNRMITEIPTFVVNNIIQINIADLSTDQYTATEAAVYVDTIPETCIAYIWDDEGIPIYSKVPGISLNLPIALAYSATAAIEQISGFVLQPLASKNNYGSVQFWKPSDGVDNATRAVTAADVRVIAPHGSKEVAGIWESATQAELDAKRSDRVLTGDLKLSLTPAEIAFSLGIYVPESEITPGDVIKLSNANGNWNKPARGNIKGFQVELWGSGSSRRQNFDGIGIGGSYVRKLYTWDEMPARVAYVVGQSQIARNINQTVNGANTTFDGMVAPGGRRDNPVNPTGGDYRETAGNAEIFSAAKGFAGNSIHAGASIAAYDITNTQNIQYRGNSIFGGQAAYSVIGGHEIGNGGGAVDATANGSGRGEVRITILRG